MQSFASVPSPSDFGHGEAQSGHMQHGYSMAPMMAQQARQAMGLNGGMGSGHAGVSAGMGAASGNVGAKTSADMQSPRHHQGGWG